MVNLEMDEEKGENIHEREDFPELVEVYVPIVFPESTAVAGVVETYKGHPPQCSPISARGRWW